MQDIITHSSVSGFKTLKIPLIANFQSWKLLVCHSQMRTEQQKQGNLVDRVVTT